MGLDITAYSNVKRLEANLDEDGEAVNSADGSYVKEGWFRVWKNPDFPGRADELEDDGIYTYENFTAHRVGYSGYFWWRDELAKMAGYPKKESEFLWHKDDCYMAGAIDSGGGPFYELINFSDCEGVIGGSIATKLLEDFKNHHEKAKEIGQQFYEHYQRWQSVMEMAAQNGCIEFH